MQRKSSGQSYETAASTALNLEDSFLSIYLYLISKHLNLILQWMLMAASIMLNAPKKTY